MKSPIRAAFLGAMMAMGGCDRPDPISVDELNAFVEANPECKRMNLGKLQEVVRVFETAEKVRSESGKDFSVDLRDPEKIQEYEANPRYVGLTYWDEAQVLPQGLLFTDLDPYLEAIKQESGSSLGITMHETLYTLVVDEGSGRRILKIEQGNLLKPGEKESNALYTTTVDLATGVVTTLDDGAGPFDDGGFELRHDKDGRVVAKEERGSHWNDDRLDAILSIAERDMERIDQKLKADQAAVETPRLDVGGRISETMGK